jgi:putative restriction endonuclease
VRKNAWLDTRTLNQKEHVMKRKYEPLGEHLAASNQKRLELTFGEIEDIIAAKLQPSAFKFEQWWENQSDVGRRPQARAWTEAGFLVANVSDTIGKRLVTFEKI